MKTETKDAEIRTVLRDFVRSEHESAPQAVFLEEFALQGGMIRADIASLNGVSHGYEIKSAGDTLARLPAQVTAYSAVFDKATLVGGKASFDRVELLLMGLLGQNPTANRYLLA